MNATELRIGNLLWDIEDDYLVKVEMIDGYEKSINGFNETYFEIVKPIPLTEEWLLKFGFEKSLDYWMKVNSGFFFGIKTDGYALTLFDDTMPINCVKHVHQLQNLYFALTGEELTINNY